MYKTNRWASISLFNLCIVAILGFVLRSKILFDMPWIDYMDLLEAHFHFAFQGWVTLALLLLLVQEILPEIPNRKPHYTWLFAGIVFCSFGALLVALPGHNSFLKEVFSYLFILITYVFSWIFLTDLRKAPLHKTTRLLAVSAIASLVLSSAGPVTLTCLHAVNSIQPFFYRDASYIYLHLQYNGFFTLAVFTLIFHRLYPVISIKVRKYFYWFSVLLCLSVLPSLFLSFLWQDPNKIFRVVAIVGSILVFLSAIWFIVSVWQTPKFFKTAMTVAPGIFLLSMIAFILKMLLQSLTIFTPIGNAVFGDRPVIIGFLHLVFLVFVTPFILSSYIRSGYLNVKIRLTRYALLLFILGVLFNEIVLMLQGLGAMFLESSYLSPWLLWVISIMLVTGAGLICFANIRSLREK